MPISSAETNDTGKRLGRLKQIIRTLNCTRERCVLPVLAVDLISSQGVVKHQDLMGVLQAWSGVLAVFQLHSSVQQREVPSDDQGVRTVCGADTN